MFSVNNGSDFFKSQFLIGAIEECIRIFDGKQVNTEPNLGRRFDPQFKWR